VKILIASTLKRKIAEDVTASRSRIIYEIASGLFKNGHEVSLIGTADSNVQGVKTIPVIDKGFAELSGFENRFYAETSFLVSLCKKVEEIGPSFDVIHNHTYPEFFNLFAGDRIKTPMITTLHAQETPEYDEVLSLFPNANLVSISNAHRSMFKKAKIQNVVYNGIDTQIFSLESKKDDYLLWIGRLGKARDENNNFVDAKGIIWAIKLAKETGERLLITGNVEDPEFFDKEVKPHLNDKIEWIGPVSAEQKLPRDEVVRLYQKAKAFLMTVNWEEPFGLVMAEAMSCGTPVIGFNRGAVSEVVLSGKTGFVVNPQEGIEGLKRALGKINSISPKDCRKHAVDNFSVQAMVNNYENLYREVVGT